MTFLPNHGDNGFISFPREFHVANLLEAGVEGIRNNDLPRNPGRIIQHFESVRNLQTTAEKKRNLKKAWITPAIPK